MHKYIYDIVIMGEKTWEQTNQSIVRCKNMFKIIFLIMGCLFDDIIYRPQK